MTDIPDQPLAAAVDAIRESACICRQGRNQHGPWYQILPTCPHCGDHAARARAVLEAAGPALLAAERERIAQAIEADAAKRYGPKPGTYVSTFERDAAARAARIARGET